VHPSVLAEIQHHNTSRCLHSLPNNKRNPVLCVDDSRVCPFCLRSHSASKCYHWVCSFTPQLLFTNWPDLPFPSIALSSLRTHHSNSVAPAGFLQRQRSSSHRRFTPAQQPTLPFLTSFSLSLVPQRLVRIICETFLSTTVPSLSTHLSAPALGFSIQQAVISSSTILLWDLVRPSRLFKRIPSFPSMLCL
jgi:hypothetical protein